MPVRSCQAEAFDLTSRVSFVFLFDANEKKLSLQNMPSSGGRRGLRESLSVPTWPDTEILELYQYLYYVRNRVRKLFFYHPVYIITWLLELILRFYLGDTHERLAYILKYFTGKKLELSKSN